MDSNDQPIQTNFTDLISYNNISLSEKEKAKLIFLITKDLIFKTKNETQRISKIAFTEYFDIPFLYSERLFEIFSDNPSHHYLEASTFSLHIESFLTCNFENLIKLTFDLFDFDKDGYISYDDITIIWSNAMAYKELNKEVCLDDQRFVLLDSQAKEKFSMSNGLKKYEKIQKMDFPSFIFHVANENADLFLVVYFYFLKIRNIMMETISYNQSDEKSNLNNNHNSKPLKRLKSKGRNIYLGKNSILEIKVVNPYSPKMFSFKLNPEDDSKNSSTPNTQRIKGFIKPFQSRNYESSNSPSIILLKNENDTIQNYKTSSTSNKPQYVKLSKTKKANSEQNFNHKKNPSLANELKLISETNANILNSFKMDTLIEQEKPKNFINVNTMDLNTFSPLLKQSSLPMNRLPGKKLNSYKEPRDMPIKIHNILRNNSENSESSGVETQETGGEWDKSEMPQINFHSMHRKNTLSSEVHFKSLNLNSILEEKFTKTNPNSPDKKHLQISPLTPKHLSSGYISKFNTNRTEVKKFFFVIHKNKLIYYNNQSSKKPKGIINLVRCFIKQEGRVQLFGRVLFCFHIFHSLNKESFFCDSKHELDSWVMVLKSLTEVDLKYTPIEFIGQGKFSVVHKGYDPVDEEEVAIKILRKTKMENIDLISTRREIEIMLVCNHPNIIKMKNFYENYEYIYIIQVFYKNSTDLYDFMRKNKNNIGENNAKFIVKKIISVIEYIHGQGIIHRDIKPENILISNDEDAGIDLKMIDFGLSRFLGKNELARNEPYGTMAYAAPEVILNKEYEKSVDLYSLGVLTYFILSGSLPFDGENEDEIRKKVLENKLVFYSARWKDISPNAVEFVKILIQPDATKRTTLQRLKKHKWL